MLLLPDLSEPIMFNNYRVVANNWIWSSCKYGPRPLPAPLLPFDPASLTGRAGAKRCETRFILDLANTPTPYGVTFFM